MLGLLNPAAILSALPYLAMLFAAGTLYNVIWENPHIRAAARAGYVSEVTLIAANAQVAEMQRQAQVAQSAADDFKAQLDKANQDAIASAKTMEISIGNYEDKLKKSGRSCKLNSSDADWLRR